MNSQERALPASEKSKAAPVQEEVIMPDGTAVPASSGNQQTSEQKNSAPKASEAEQPKSNPGKAPGSENKPVNETK